VALLELEHVNKRYRRGNRELVALRGVSLEIDNGEVVCVSGARGSGRTTLLRVAAGIEAPDEGRVRFAGCDLRTIDHSVRRQLVMCNTRFLRAHGADVTSHVMFPLMAVRVPSDDAGLRAHRALERVGADHLAFESPESLVPAEQIRVALARAIVREPRMMIVDEPTSGVDVLERDPLLSLIQSLAHERGMAVLLSASETGSVTGADRLLRLSEGELLGRTTAAEPADVIELRRRSASSESS